MKKTFNTYSLTTFRLCKCIGIYLVMLSFFLMWTMASYAHAVPTEKILESLLDQGEEAFAKNKHLEALKFFIKAKQIADDKSKPSYQCLARYDIGVCYFLMSEHGEALHNYYEAYKICQENDLGRNRKAKIINGIAGVYFEQEDYKRAYDFVLPCYRDSKNMNDTLSQQIFATDLSLICNKLGKYSNALQYIEISKRLIPPGTSEYAHCLTIEAETMFLQKLYAKAEALCLRTLSIKDIWESDRGILLIYLMNIYGDRRDFARALSYVDEARQASALRNLPYFYSTLSDVYRKAGNLDKALACKDSVIIFNDSIKNVANKQLLDNAHTKLEVLRFTSDMEQQMDKIRQRHFILIILLCLCVVLVVIAFTAVRNQKAKTRHQSQILVLEKEKRQREKQMAEERMKSVEMEARYRQEMMNQSLEQKQRELSATTMFVSSRNELIEDLLNYLNNETDIKSVPAVKTLTLHLRHLLKENNEKENFLVNFEAANPGFMQHLQSLHPDLLPSDLRFLAYVRMNLQTKEIASLLNINPESCRRRKIRLSKKLNLDSSSELYNYIIGM